MENNKDINKIIGKNLLALRKDKKLTQVELAEMFNYSDKSISKWETGESLPSIEVLYELSKFYGTSLDSLTREDFQIEKPDAKKVRDKLLPAHLVITLLATSVVWLLATILFVSVKLTYSINYGIIFLWALPISCVVLLIFNAIWGKNYLMFVILSLLNWSLLTSIHLQVLIEMPHNIWPIYLLGIPLQIAIILWAILLQKPRTKQREKKPKKEKQPKTKDKNLTSSPQTNPQPTNTEPNQNETTTNSNNPTTY